MIVIISFIYIISILQSNKNGKCAKDMNDQLMEEKR